MWGPDISRVPSHQWCSLPVPPPVGGTGLEWLSRAHQPISVLHSLPAPPDTTPPPTRRQNPASRPILDPGSCGPDRGGGYDLT